MTAKTVRIHINFKFYTTHTDLDINGLSSVANRGAEALHQTDRADVMNDGKREEMKETEIHSSIQSCTNYVQRTKTGNNLK